MIIWPCSVTHTVLYMRRGGELLFKAESITQRRHVTVVTNDRDRSLSVSLNTPGGDALTFPDRGIPLPRLRPWLGPRGSPLGLSRSRASIRMSCPSVHLLSNPKHALLSSGSPRPYMVTLRVWVHTVRSCSLHFLVRSFMSRSAGIECLFSSPASALEVD